MVVDLAITPICSFWMWCRYIVKRRRAGLIGKGAKGCVSFDLRSKKLVWSHSIMVRISVIIMNGILSGPLFGLDSLTP